LTPFASKGAHRNAPSLSIGQQTFLLAQFLEIPLALPLGNFSQQYRTQQRAPKDGPIFIVTTHQV
jgi:hypothetical protein